MEIPALDDRLTWQADVVVVGGGTAGTMAAITAAEQGASVLLLEKAHVRHSGALAMGMDGVNNAVIPGKAKPEDYVAEITRANDGVINQRTIYQTATRGYDMVRRLERYGVKFDKDEHGEYHVRRVHRSGSYVLPMPEGKDVKKVLYRVLRERRMRERVRIENRVMPVRLLTAAGRICGLAGFNTRTGEFVTVRTPAVILATGACGRLGLPASGYLYGTYENPTNAGDGHAMAYHAGAELSGIECFQINPLIKDYNGPACAYVANPFGGYQVNNNGDRFVDCDYWSGHMMSEVSREISSARGPIYLKLTHLPEEKLSALENILHTTERPTRGTFHANRGHDYRTHDVEMHISEIGLCGGHSSSGVWVDENAATTVPGLYAAGDLACVPHNYMIGAFVFGDLAGAHATQYTRDTEAADLPEDQVAAAHELIYRPLRNPDGPPQQQVEYKLRRFVNDYVAPPKSDTKLTLAIETFDRMRTEIEAMGARTPHELMRCVEVSFIRDCAEMAARSSLVRTESRWGLYHERLDQPTRDDKAWFYHLNLRKRADEEMEFLKRPVQPYLVPVPEFQVPTDQKVELLGTTKTTKTNSQNADAKTEDKTPTPTQILKLLALAENHPTLPQLRPYLTDPDPRVRRTAINTLTETLPPETDLALVNMLADPEPEVREAAANALRELADLLVPTDRLQNLLIEATSTNHPESRAVAIDLLRVTRQGNRALFAESLTDAEIPVRLAAISALISLDAAEDLATAATDPSREVRVAVATGIGTLGPTNPGPEPASLPPETNPLRAEPYPPGPQPETPPGPGTHAPGPEKEALPSPQTERRPEIETRPETDLRPGTYLRPGTGLPPGNANILAKLATDPDPLVQAAALSAAANLGCPAPLDTLALAALTAPEWQIRAAAATALGGIKSLGGNPAPGDAAALAGGATTPGRATTLDGATTLGGATAADGAAAVGRTRGGTTAVGSVTAADGPEARGGIKTLGAATLGGTTFDGAEPEVASTEPEVAIAALRTALTDPHLDVRKAAASALARWPTHPEVRQALHKATTDPDADVRAYARRALTPTVAR